MTIDADVSRTIRVGSARRSCSDAACQRASGPGLEPRWTGADGLTIDDGTESVGSTETAARIDARVCLANGLRRTVGVSVRAVTAGSAAGGVRIADSSRWAFADMAGRRGFADGGRVTRTGAAQFRWYAFYFGIAPVTWRALAIGAVIFGNADCIASARVFLANVVATVRQTITQLMTGTVDVVNAGHGLAPRGEVVGISRIRTRGALTTRHMVIDQANGVRTAHDRLAGWSTTQDSRSGVRTASFQFRALRIGGALVLQNGFAAVPIVRITRKIWQTLTVSFVGDRNADRIARTSEFRASGNAFKYAQGVRLTGGSLGAVFVLCAVGKRRSFADGFYRVPDESVGAAAYWMSSGIQRA